MIDSAVGGPLAIVESAINEALDPEDRRPARLVLEDLEGELEMGLDAVRRALVRDEGDVPAERSDVWTTDRLPVGVRDAVAEAAIMGALDPEELLERVVDLANGQAVGAPVTGRETISIIRLAAVRMVMDPSWRSPLAGPRPILSPAAAAEARRLRGMLP